MIVGFLSNKMTLRGTEVGLYDYADQNETLLGNKSIIITRPLEHVLQVSPRDVSPETQEKFKKRFEVQYYIEPSDVEKIIQDHKIDVVFIEKGGWNTDGLNFKSCKTINHIVFETREPHGTLCTSISHALNHLRGTNLPVLPQIIRVFDTDENLRNQLNIPEDATVFGAQCGADEQTNENVKKAVSEICVDPKQSNIYFIYLNVDKFGPESPRLIFLPGTPDLRYKRMFINTCDAMLYARNGGETFGLACGEFAMCNKPVIATPGLEMHAHEDYLGNAMIRFTTQDQIQDILTHWENQKRDASQSIYKQFTAHNVMGLFQYILTHI